jgi:hypothetical protein
VPYRIASIEDDVDKKVLSKIRSYFDSNVFDLIMIDFDLTHKALRAKTAIDGLGVFKNVTNSIFIKHLKVNSTSRLCLVM